MRFIDLFAGLGGFHVALEKLGHECVFASEKSIELAKLYEVNFDISVNSDITQIAISNIPHHDILCAGFPCQPFSKAGAQEGLRDVNNGNLFYTIVDILQHHKPKYFILENVKNIEKHDGGRTWSHMRSILEDELKYSVGANTYSPHHISIPQHRERFFIVGSLNGDIDDSLWPSKDNPLDNIKKYITDTFEDEFKISDDKREALKVWQKFLTSFPKSHKLPSWPIWAMEFGATYPYETSTPFSSNNYQLGRCKGVFGTPLKGLNSRDKWDLLPTYAKTQESIFPKWKQRFIRNNREFYIMYKDVIDEVLPLIMALPIASYQKFEWNFQSGVRDIYAHLIQFRGSGIRIKRADYFPSLVTVRTQTPVVGWQQRHITPQEGAKIQCLDMIELPSSLPVAYRALGNAVNSEIVYLIAKQFIGFSKESNESIKIVASLSQK